MMGPRREVSGGYRPLPVADDWFSAVAVGGGVTLLTEPHVDPFLRSNIWLVAGRDRDLLVDSGNGVAPLLAVIRDVQRADGKPVVAVATHTHSDHMGGMHEFTVRLVHRLEAAALEQASDAACLVTAAFPEELRREIAAGGLHLPEVLVDAAPHASFDPAAFAVAGAAPTEVVDEGDEIGLGDRSFKVLHLPGHSPGSIGLWEVESGTLFAGDAVFGDGLLLDELPGSDIPAYVETMRRLTHLPVTIVHGGHDPSFGRARLVEIAEGYLDLRARPSPSS
jgi:glyoxylase-like metal-dependent hydrolase (beta-lactamase superfamily II)